MRLHVFGVRGSTPAPGPEFVRYGGHTSCVALAHDGMAPSLVLDAGTGIRRLTGVLGGLPFRGTILLGHLHWDHTRGLPFFAAGDHPDARVHLYLPEQGDAVEILSRAMSPPHFPISPQELRGDWSFDGLCPGQHELEGFTVLALDIPHKGGRTFGFRVSDGAASVAYLSDHSPVTLGPGAEGLGEYHQAAMALAQGVDLLVHDAQHTAEEFEAKRSFGHSAVEYAVGLAREAGARRLLLFHHDPPRTDDALDAIVASHQDGPVPVEAAVEETTVELP
ncbi:MAG: MBL fold metallo-hydrolase [Actinomycetota bacterium]|nr:MBL fold metallo-hydrolase [Actinomycetota bacterium]